MTLASSLENNKSKNFDYLYIIPEGKNERRKAHLPFYIPNA